MRRRAPACSPEFRAVFCQDERVMQLFGLVNTMLANDHVTAERDLSIARCAGLSCSPGHTT